MDFFHPAHILLVVLPLGLGLGCRKPPNSREQYPKFWVKHETIEYKLSLLSSQLTGGEVGSPIFYRLGRGHDILRFFIGSINNYDVIYDINNKQWKVLTSFVDPRPYRSNPAEVDTHREEDNQAYETAKAKFETEENRIDKSLTKWKQDYFTGFPQSWMLVHVYGDKDLPAPEAAHFEYRIEGRYVAQFRKGGGGWWGGESKSTRKYEQFLGVRTMLFDGKPVFQVDDEQMDSNTYVVKDLNTVIYKHRSVDSIRLDIMDLSELKNGNGGDNDSKNIVSSTGVAVAR